MNRSLKLAVVALTLPLLMGGCSSVEDKKKITELEQQVTDLQTENTSLKGQLETLKTSFGEQKTAELQQALAGAGAAPTTAAASGSTPGQTSETKPKAEQPVAATPTLTDLSETPAKSMIEDLAKLNVFSNIANGQFNPDKPITRGQYVEWLYKAYNAIEPVDSQLRFAPQVAQQFKDTPPTNPQYKYVQALANAGYSIGYKDGTFRPDKPLTREEMIGIKVGLDVGKEIPPYRSQMEYIWKFSDCKDIDERFTGYIQQDYYVSGPNGSNIQRAFGKIGAFRPKQAVTRAEAAGTLWQMGQFGGVSKTTAEDVLKKQDS